MSFSATAADERVEDVKVADGALRVALRDGRSIAVPLAWYPRLLNATPGQRSNWKIAGGGYGIYWPDIDEDLSTEGLLRGVAAPGVREKSEVGRLDPETLLSVTMSKPVQSCALDAACIDAAEQMA
jgi:hypothetical protein